MAGVKTQSGLYSALLAWMKKTPNKLVTRYEVMEKFGNSHNVDESVATSALGYLYRQGKIFRHVDKADYGEGSKVYQYAVSIPAEKRVAYEPGEKKSRKSTKQGLSKKEVQALFMQIQNAIAKLEDEIITSVERREELEKEITRMKNSLSKF